MTSLFLGVVGKGHRTLLQVDVSQLLEHLGETQSVRTDYALDVSGDDYTVKSPVTVDLTLLSIGDGAVLVQGTVNFEVEAACSRCLSRFSKGYEVRIQEEYQRAAARMTATAKDMELGEEDFAYVIDGEGHIDLGEAIRQNVIVNLPLRFVCKKDCGGLKSNNSPKDEGSIDPRLAELRKLKEK